VASAEDLATEVASVTEADSEVDPREEDLVVATEVGLVVVTGLATEVHRGEGLEEGAAGMAAIVVVMVVTAVVMQAQEGLVDPRQAPQGVDTAAGLGEDIAIEVVVVDIVDEAAGSGIRVQAAREGSATGMPRTGHRPT